MDNINYKNVEDENMKNGRICVISVNTFHFKEDDGYIRKEQSESIHPCNDCVTFWL